MAENVSGPLTPDALEALDAYWRACNYLAAGMIYLRTTRCCVSRWRPHT